MAMNSATPPSNPHAQHAEPSTQHLPVHTTISGAENKPVYMPADIAHLDYARDLGNPGTFPLRAAFTTMYRGEAVDHAAVCRVRGLRKRPTRASNIFSLMGRRA